MLLTKHDIRNLIVQGELKKAAEEALAYAEYCGGSDAANYLSILLGRLSEHSNQWGLGVISYEEFSRGHAKISYDLTNIMDSLPDQPAPGSAKSTLTDEATFKKRLFYFMCGSKLTILLAVFHQYNTGGFNGAKLFAVLGLIIPVFVTYLTIIIEDYLRQHHSSTIPVRRFVSGPLVSFTYLVFPLYTLSMVYAIQACAGGTEADLYKIEDLNKIFMCIETLLGAYIGQIVGKFFKEA